MKRICITGIGGNIGYHALAHFLHNTDWEIVGMDSWAHKGTFDRVTQVCHDHPDWPERIKIVTHDLNAPITDREIEKIGKIDYVLNLASLSDVQDSIDNPVRTLTNNSNLMVNMLEYAREIKPEVFIQFSTDEVYGPCDKDSKGHKEWDRIAPSNPQGVSQPPASPPLSPAQNHAPHQAMKPVRQRTNDWTNSFAALLQSAWSRNQQAAVVQLAGPYYKQTDPASIHAGTSAAP